MTRRPQNIVVGSVVFFEHASRSLECLLSGEVTNIITEYEEVHTLMGVAITVPTYSYYEIDVTALHSVTFVRPEVISIGKPVGLPIPAQVTKLDSQIRHMNDVRFLK